MNTFGTNFRVEIFGESHGVRIGVIVDGCPAGIPLCENDFTEDLQRRRSGGLGSTPRIEADLPSIVSGVYDMESLLSDENYKMWFDFDTICVGEWNTNASPSYNFTRGVGDTGIPIESL